MTVLYTIMFGLAWLPEAQFVGQSSSAVFMVLWGGGKERRITLYLE